MLGTSKVKFAATLDSHGLAKLKAEPLPLKLVRPKAAAYRLSDCRSSSIATTAVIASTISFLLRRSKSISDGFSIRGPFQIASFRLSKAVEGVTKLVAPPLLKFHAVSLSKGIQLIL